jgi:hypothetical protein
MPVLLSGFTGVGWRFKTAVARIHECYLLEDILEESIELERPSIPLVVFGIFGASIKNIWCVGAPAYHLLPSAEADGEYLGDGLECRVEPCEGSSGTTSSCLAIILAAMLMALL